MPDAANLTKLCQTYLAQIEKQKKLANSTEEMSYRGFLDVFLRESAEAIGKDVQWTGEARKLKVGRPDFEVTDGLTVYGYVEAESVFAELNNLKGSAKSQNDRFKETLHCLLLTNHTAFQVFVDGKLVEEMQFSTVPTPGEAETWRKLLDRFLNEAVPHAHSAEEVAKQLAKRAKDLRHAAELLLSQETSALHAFWNAYKSTLYEDLPADKFADIYAQTFVYGLFLAWLQSSPPAPNSGGAGSSSFLSTPPNLGVGRPSSLVPFTRQTALNAVPNIVPPVAALLDAGGGKKLPDELVWIVNGVCSDLSHADKEAALKPFGEGRDPILHFYETFLAAYDKTLRKSRGVYYTPDSVVEFIVKAVDDLLKKHFGKPDGLADPTVTLLDPAVGTGTFLAHAVRHVKHTLTEKNMGGLWQSRAENHIARHFFGFELLPAAYTLAHIKIRSLLKELGAPLPGDIRLPIYLTNTLDEGIPHGDNLPFVETLREESELAAKVKGNEPILVVMGNPPYSGSSANPGRNKDGSLNYIGKLVDRYYSVDGKPLGEKNPKWLQDDYVKFLRFAEDRIARSGSGVVAFITNHGYLDNPTFRGLRRHLMQTFDLCYFYDLHGNSKKKETNPTGGPDENVFDIQQGVAICLLVKLPKGKDTPSPVPFPFGKGRGENPSESPPLSEGGGLGGGSSSTVPAPKLFHADLFGTRSHKYSVLQEQSMEGVAWNKIVPSAPLYLFAPQDETVRAEYEAGWSVKDIFPVNSVGIVTARDALTIKFTADDVWNTVTDFVGLDVEAARVKYDLGDDARDWKVTFAQKDLKNSGLSKTKIVPILYRPYDIRFTYYTGHSKGFQCMPRGEIMPNMLAGNNLGLIVPRVAKANWDALVTDKIIGHKAVEGFDINYLFPLHIYLYPNAEDIVLRNEKRTNLNPDFVKQLTNTLGFAPEPTETFAYIYSLLHSPLYRARYGEFLRRDFPRIPLPPTSEVFRWGVNAGNALIGLHLLHTAPAKNNAVGFPNAGTNIVGKMRSAERFIAGGNSTEAPPAPNTGGAGNILTPPVLGVGGFLNALAEGPSVIIGRIRLNTAQSFTNVPEDVWNMRVGGYVPAQKWLDDRTERTLFDEDITHYCTLLASLRQTLTFLPACDAVFAAVLENALVTHQ